MGLRTVAFLFVAVTVSLVRSNEIRCYACEDCTKEKPAIVQCSAKNGIDVNALSYTPTYPVLTQSTPPWAYPLDPWNPNLTPPPLVGGNNGNYWDPWNPNLTPPPLVGGNNGGGNYWDPWNPNLTPPPLVGGNNGGNYWDPWNPNLTPPPLVGGNNGGNYWDPWNPNLTPPPLVGGNNGGGNYWDPWNPNLTPPPLPWYPYVKANKSLKAQKRFVCVSIMSQDKDRAKNVVHRRGCAEIEGYATGVCDKEQVPHVEGGITGCRVCGHSLCNE
ncbi:uncharacterized protein LOC131293052 [Anopheles ziemanni]|uniref:uncharacterized protein LOC131263992 n=1 Tax=Anopheles coustani TaxID=139045 RepID=UPI002658563A|nr:uncharacterized protein LOC131263992 [Anopheles coustani]XP_058177114.1 uncharacterized protein LOC131293052 [Anopheles ziemanni]